jgi:hypothetical protein
MLRPQNSAMLVKIETTEGVDSNPTAIDAIPFELDGLSYNYPFTSEASNEVTGSLAAGTPLIVGQAAEITFRSRVKGANAGYSASVRPPLHPMFLIAGWKGLFTTAVAAAALAAGSVSTATLAASFSNAAQAYRGMPLVLSAGVGAGRTTFVSDYTSGRVATLVDAFTPALDATTQAAIPANWTYAPTSPKSAAERLTDHPSATIYLYEDGTLLRFTGCRAMLDLSADAAKPGFISWRVMGVFQGQSDAAVPNGIALPGQIAPTLVQGAGAVNPALLINRAGLPISQMSLQTQVQMETPADPNTPYGFGPAIIGGRAHQLQLDPLKSLIAVRNTLALLEGGSIFTGVAKFGTQANNRWALVLPRLTHANAAPGTRGQLRSEQVTYQALDDVSDPNGRGADAIITFW